jgi:hypothetical protein
MSRWLVLSVAPAAVLVLAVVVLRSVDGDSRPAPGAGPAVKKPPRCPEPSVTILGVRPVSEDGERIAVRIRAEMERPGIGSVEVSWGNSSGLIADGWWGRRGTTAFEHRYPGPGSYRITVVAEGSSKDCKRLRKSPPARARVRIPLSRTTDPSFP